MRHFGGNTTLRLFKLPWREAYASPPISGPLYSMETSPTSPTCNPLLTRYTQPSMIAILNGIKVFQNHINSALFSFTHLFGCMTCFYFCPRSFFNLINNGECKILQELWLLLYLLCQLQTPASFAQSVQELTIALQRTGDPANLNRLRPHLELLANIDPSPGCYKININLPYNDHLLIGVLNACVF